MIDHHQYNVIDLTRSYQKGIAGFDFETAKTIEKDGWNARNLFLYSHSGTHMDAPYHFNVTNQTIDTYPPERFISKAWVITVEIMQDKQLITPADLGVVKDHFQPGESLLLRTNWSRFINTPDYVDQMPRISKPLAEWCVANRVNILGVEPPSVADVRNLPEVTEIHQILLAGDIIIIEGLTHLDQIQQEVVTLIALPLKIKDGDGAPARVIALEEKSI